MASVSAGVDSIAGRRQAAEAEKIAFSSLRKISSGLRIDRAADSPASLAISEGLRAAIGGLAEASRNAQQAVNMAQVAEGGLGQIDEALQRMRQLSVQSASTTLNDQDRAAIASEYNQLKSEIDRISANTEYNGTRVLAGDTQTFQVGAAAGSSNQMTLSTGPVNSAALGISTTSVTEQSNAANSTTAIDQAIEMVASQRSALGSFQNRLGSTISATQNAIENTQAAESLIRDVDFATEVTNLASAMVRQQAGIASMAHGNLSAQAVRTLLG